MDAKHTVLLVGDKPDTIAVAKSFGLDVILFQHKARLAPESSRLADALVVVDYTDWGLTRPLAEAARQAWGFASAASLAETGLVTAGLINDRYRLPGPSFAVSHLLRNKWAMRQHLAGAIPPGVAAGLATSRDALAAFGGRHGYPFIVKPTELSAGFGVLRVRDRGDTDRVWRQILELRRDGVTAGPGLFSIDDFLMEPFIDGPEYSVEAFSFRSRHVVVAITEKLVHDATFVELGHALPARLGPVGEKEVREATIAFLDAVGLTDGPSHTEVKLSKAGPVVVESHNRVGGDKINELVAAAYGINLREYAIGWQFGLVPELPDHPRPRCAAATRFLYAPEPGAVAEVAGLDRVRAHPGVLLAEVAVRPGDLVGPLRNNWDRLGQVAVTGPDTGTAADLCDRLAAAISIVRRPV